MNICFKWIFWFFLTKLISFLNEYSGFLQNLLIFVYFCFSLPASKTVVAKCLKLTCQVFLLSLTSPLFLTRYKYFQNFHKNGRQRYFRQNGPLFIFNFHYFQFSILNCVTCDQFHNWIECWSNFPQWRAGGSEPAGQTELLFLLSIDRPREFQQDFISRSGFQGGKCQLLLQGEDKIKLKDCDFLWIWWEFHSL